MAVWSTGRSGCSETVAERLVVSGLGVGRLAAAGAAARSAGAP